MDTMRITTRSARPSSWKMHNYQSRLSSSRVLEHIIRMAWPNELSRPLPIGLVPCCFTKCANGPKPEMRPFGLSHSNKLFTYGTTCPAHDLVSPRSNFLLELNRLLTPCSRMPVCGDVLLTFSTPSCKTDTSFLNGRSVLVLA